MESPWDLAFAASVLVFVVALGFAVVPPPARVNPATGQRKSLGIARTATAKAEALARAGSARVVDRTWAMEPEALGVQVMGTVGRAAERRHLQVSNFTVGRTIPSAGLRQVPFMVTLSGSFPDVLGAMAELERPNSRLVIGGVKLSPNGATTSEVAATGEGGLADPGRVTATLSITAFLRGEGA